jgi:hypothetical protein
LRVGPFLAEIGQDYGRYKELLRKHGFEPDSCLFNALLEITDTRHIHVLDGKTKEEIESGIKKKLDELLPQYKTA